MGEMVGNIAHQWKQPLNSMALNLSNMNDDFYAKELTSGEFDGSFLYESKVKIEKQLKFHAANDMLGIRKRPLGKCLWTG